MRYTTLAITPREDVGTQMLGDWWAEFLRSIQGLWHPDFREIHTISPQMPQYGPITRQNVETRLARHATEIDIVVFLGNGTRCSVCVRSNPGDIATPQRRMYNPPWYCNYCRRCFRLPVGQFLIDPDNTHPPTGQAMYVVACCTAEALGSILMQRNVPEKAYFGYRGEIYDPSRNPALVAEMQNVIVGSLRTLHDRWAMPDFASRCKATECAVKSGFAQLRDRLRAQARGNITPEEVLVNTWSLNFVAWYGSSVPT